MPSNASPDPGSPPVATLDQASPGRLALAGILTVSALALAGLLALVYGRGPIGPQPAWVAYLPPVNALFNATSALAIVLGVAAIRRGRTAAHRQFMLAAFGASSLFLVSYITYHALHGDTKFPGTGTLRAFYLFILASHVLLSIGALPLVLVTFYLSLTGRLAAHRRVARWTFPIWLYVSTTGVLVYLMLHWLAPSLAS